MSVQKAAEHVSRQARPGDFDVLVRALVALAESDAPTAAFYEQLWARLSAEMDFCAAALFTCSADREFVPGLQWGSARHWRDVDARRDELLRRVCQRGVPMVTTIESHDADHDLPVADGESNVALCPLVVEGRAVAVIELIEDTQRPWMAQESFLRRLELVSKIASEYHRRHELRELRGERVRLVQRERFLRAVHAARSVTEVAYEIVNEGRPLVGADRLTVAICRHGRCRVAAISGMSAVNRRASAVRALARLAQGVIAVNEAVWYTEDARELPPYVESNVAEYLDASHARCVGVVPLAAPSSRAVEPRALQKASVCGALILEWFDRPSDEEAIDRRSADIAEHAAIALFGAMDREALFLYPLWRQMGRLSRWVTQRSLTRLVAPLVLVAAVVTALAVVPADFTVEGSGVLESALRRDVFASTDGVVREVRVRHGDTVHQGDTVAVLANHELELKIRSVRGELATAQKRLAVIRASKLDAPSAPTPGRAAPSEWAAEEAELMAWLVGLQAQVDLLRHQQDELVVRSPIDGEVTTWNVAERLAGRPVSRGDMLLSVSDTQGPWVLEVFLPEKRAGHLLTARRQRHGRQEVSFVLAGDPLTIHRGVVSRLAGSTQADAAKGNVLLVTVEVDGRQLRDPRPGAAATARIDCGQRPIAYVWLHELWEFVHARVLFRL